MTGGTLVLQSYRTRDVPAWIAECLASVRDWAAGAGHDYRLLGDELFDPLPETMRMLGAPPALPATDLARLLWCRRLLGEGAARVIWLDADILVVRPDAFSLEPSASGLLCRELWIWREAGRISARWAVNNCAMAFGSGAPLLDRYIAACEALAGAAVRPLHRLALGPTLLTRMNRETPLALIDTIPTLSPALIDALLNGDTVLVRSFLELWAAPVDAVHLCRSLGAEGGGPRLNSDRAEPEVVALLRRSPETLAAPGPAASLPG